MLLIWFDASVGTSTDMGLCRKCEMKLVASIVHVCLYSKTTDCL